MYVNLLTRLALSTVHHRINRVGHFLFRRELPFRGGGGEVGGGGGGGLGGHDAALVFLHRDGGFLDVGGLEGAEVVRHRRKFSVFSWKVSGKSG